MAGEIIYADLNIPEAFPTSKSLHPSQHPNIHQCPRWHRIALWLGWTGNVILVAALISLRVWGPFGGQTQGQIRTDGTERNSSQEDSQSCLKTKSDNSPEGCGCNLCPADWLLHKNKCYWVSKDSKYWKESQDDCSAKGSQMLMIQDKEELGYILSIPQMNQVWLGLRFITSKQKWTWVNGAILNETLFQVKGETGPDSCGMIKRNCTISETCMATAKWICEKAALK